MTLQRRIDAAERLLAATVPEGETRPDLSHLADLSDEELRARILAACDRIEQHADPEARAWVERERARILGGQLTSG